MERELAAGLTARNPRIKRLRRLVGNGRARREAGVIVVEGPTLVVEAVAAAAGVVEVFVEEGAVVPAELGDLAVTLVAPGVLSQVLSSRTPQPIAAEVARPAWTADALAVDRAVLVLVDVADPGNLGSLWRSAEAAGCAGVAVVGHGVDPTNPKVIRAAAGAALRCPLVCWETPEEAIGTLREQGRPVFATSVAGSTATIAHFEADLGSAAIVLGNEAHGLSPEVVAAADGCVHIPLAGPTESLGVAAAGAVLAFEALHQRRRSMKSPGGSTCHE